MRTAAKAGVMWPRAKECQEPPEPEAARKGPPQSRRGWGSGPADAGDAELPSLWQGVRQP